MEPCAVLQAHTSTVVVFMDAQAVTGPASRIALLSCCSTTAIEFRPHLMISILARPERPTSVHAARCNKVELTSIFMPEEHMFEKIGWQA